VKYRDAAGFRQALEQRLKTRASGDGARLARDRKRVAFDRLLARLTVTAPESWLLKGGFALDRRLVERARATKDIDIDWQVAEGELLDTLLEAAEHEMGDFFDFAVERTGTPEDRLGGSHRFRMVASLAGRQFETFLLDVGFRREQILAEAVRVPSELERSRADAAALLDPILKSADVSGAWDPDARRWLDVDHGQPRPDQRREAASRRASRESRRAPLVGSLRGELVGVEPELAS
jgi:nucleotidyltransferase AbiEii toxin of type IV toxin-antitoxin system